MPYFAQLPDILYQFPDNVVRQINNLAFSPDIIQSVIQNASNYIYYTIQDGDTPDTIANDYYGDPTLHWVILLTNSIVNVYVQWPKSVNELNDYILYKYRNVQATNGTIVTLTDEQVYNYTQFVGSAQNNWTDSERDEFGNQVILHPVYFQAPDELGNTQNYSWDFINNENQNPRDAYGNVLKKPLNPYPVSYFQMEDMLNTNKRQIIVLKQAVIAEIQNELRDLANGFWWYQ